MKVIAVMVPLLVGILVVHWTSSVVKAQTFQYSRGWTNGKRSGVSLPWADQTLLTNDSAPEMLVEGDNNILIPTTSNCATYGSSVIILKRERMLELIAFSMRNQKFINVVVCMDPNGKKTHMHVDF